jgi:RNA polymerase sigma-70 factor (ECF subfamily)
MADEVSFDEFYLVTRGAVLGQLTAMTLDRELAADSVQEAYVRAWQRWSRVSSLDDPIAWVRTVAWRLAVSQFRRRAVATRVLRRLDPGPPAAELSPDVTVDVVAALRTLSAEHRRVLVLYEVAGQSVREIAAETDVAEGTVKSRLFRAREQLGAALGADYLDASAPSTAGPTAALDGRVLEEER